MAIKKVKSPVRKITIGRFEYRLWKSNSIIRTEIGQKWGICFRREAADRWSYNPGGSAYNRRYYPRYEELENAFAELMIEKHIFGV